MAVLSLFPPGSALGADGMLTVGGCRADDLASEFGTPALPVAERALRARAQEYRSEMAARWPRSRVVFASKAFPCTPVQRAMVEEGLGLDVAANGTRRIPVVFATDGAARLVVRRETSADRLARDVE